jgi:hypothetical protein
MIYHGQKCSSSAEREKCVHFLPTPKSTLLTCLSRKPRRLQGQAKDYLRWKLWLQPAAAAAAADIVAVAA